VFVWEVREEGGYCVGRIKNIMRRSMKMRSSLRRMLKMQHSMMWFLVMKEHTMKLFRTEVRASRD